MSKKLDIHAECVSCKHQWVMNPEQMRDAQLSGSPTCPHCHSVGIVTKAEMKKTARKGGGK